MNSSAAPRLTTAARGTGLWFVASGTSLKGPFSFEELVVELDSSRVTPGDFCWRQGFQEWRPVCSVEEFGISRDRPTLLSPYPSVPLPSTGRVGRRSTDRKQNPLSYAATTARPRVVEEHRVVKLRVQKNSRSTMTWVERLGFFFFSILTSYLSVWVVTSEFESGLDKVIFVRNLGNLESLGNTHSEEVALPYYTVGPVLSAPGFLNPGISVPVEVDGALEKVGIQNYTVNNLRVQGVRPMEDWSPKKLGIESFFVRQFSVTGQLSATHPGVLRYLHDGEPNEFVRYSAPGDKYRP